MFTQPVTWPVWLLTVFYTFATGMSITVGYHRLFAHRAFKAHPVLQFLVLFFGAGAFEMSALGWASQHRTHHKYVDTERDPYNIKQGFFYAHIGWMLFWIQPIDYSNSKGMGRRLQAKADHFFTFSNAFSICFFVIFPSRRILWFIVQ